MLIIPWRVDHYSVCYLYVYTGTIFKRNGLCDSLAMAKAGFYDHRISIHM